MNLIKELLNPKRMLFIVPIVILGLTTVYFGLKANKLSEDLKNQKLNLESAGKESLKLKAVYDDLKKDYVSLQKNYDKINSDYQVASAELEKLKVQVRSLLSDRALARKLEGELEGKNKQIESIEKEKQELASHNLTLEGRVKDLETIQKQLIKEKDGLVEELERAKEKSTLIKLESENTSLKKENSDLANSLKQARSELAKLEEAHSESKDELLRLTERLDRVTKDYEEAVKKNRLFERTVVDTPAKFAEIARQNKALIKQTANMHYNLGVFYTKHKDYNRAVSEFTKAVELTPDDAYSHFNLGYIYAEYLANRPKAVEHFRQYLRYAKKGDKDIDWVKKYIVTWQTWEGKQPLE